jgi:hypothetical protein
MSNAYAKDGPEGAHACALPAPFPWVRDVMAVLATTVVVLLAVLVRHKTPDTAAASGHKGTLHQQ